MLCPAAAINITRVYWCNSSGMKVGYAGSGHLVRNGRNGIGVYRGKMACIKEGN